MIDIVLSPNASHFSWCIRASASGIDPWCLFLYSHSDLYRHQCIDRYTVFLYCYLHPHLHLCVFICPSFHFSMYMSLKSPHSKSCLFFPVCVSLPHVAFSAFFLSARHSIELTGRCASYLHPIGGFGCDFVCFLNVNTYPVILGLGVFDKPFWGFISHIKNGTLFSFKACNKIWKSGSLLAIQALSTLVLSKQTETNHPQSLKKHLVDSLVRNETLYGYLITMHGVIDILCLHQSGL